MHACMLLLALSMSGVAAGAEEVQGFPLARARQALDLSGIWEILPDAELKGIEARWFEPGAAEGWKPIAVPATWETVLGITFDTVAWYRKRFAVPAATAGNRVLLRFHGAATEARVWVDGVEVGSHLGCWTPFTFDITERVKPGAQATIVVRLDEKVGHNTQGFLPIVAPHFGGLWQRVEVFTAGPAWLDDTRFAIDASKIDEGGETGALEVSIPAKGSLVSECRARFTLSTPDGALLAAGENTLDAGGAPGADTIASWRWNGPVKLWDIGAGSLYTIEVSLLGPGNEILDRVRARFGFRAVEARGDQILLNGRPIIVRGVLTWGVFPPLLAPAPDVERLRGQLAYLRACGFNLMKFCLYMPPAELLDAVDEAGMLSWIEYPTWHPRIDQAHREELVREYGEMSFHDSRHPSAILRSITCETGATADLEVLRELYALLKARAPGTLVEDDSSWIGWNRINDFWDDHPYGNNRTWRGVLKGFSDHIQQHGVKPLLLGEAIAADTWSDSKKLLDHSVDGRPWWAPNWLGELLVFEQKLEERFGRPGFSPVENIKQTALTYCMDMRRWQIETYREQMPHAGYVVSVIRDTRLCAMGLLDDFERPKWIPPEWQWHGPVMASLLTPYDQRAFRCDQGGKIAVTPCIRVSADAGSVGEGEVRWEVPGSAASSLAWGGTEAPGGDRLGKEVVFSVENSVTRPTRVSVHQDILPKNGPHRRSSWDLWALPAPAPVPPGAVLYGDHAGKDLAKLFPGAVSVEAGKAVPEGTPVVVTCALTAQVMAYLEKGGKVLHITSSVAGSIREEDIWFLRGVAWAPPVPEAFFERVPREMLPYLQLFDLGGGTIIRGEKLWEQVDPLLSFLETHDLTRVRPNLMLFITGAGAGKLAVSCLRHEGGEKENYAGLWLAREIVAYLCNGPAPSRALTPELVEALKTGLSAEVRHVEGPWRFTKDPTNAGLDQGWFKTDFDDRAWIELAPRSAEEGKIWNAYDGWGWYRKRISIPAAWKGARVRIVFDSVDDMYELFVNGRKAGSYGKQDQSQSSFLTKTWVDVGEFVRPGEENLFALRVYDWVGSGGIGGPVWLTTGPVEEGLDLLKR
jgi:hypothetical protein